MNVRQGDLAIIVNYEDNSGKTCIVGAPVVKHMQVLCIVNGYPVIFLTRGEPCWFIEMQTADFMAYNVAGEFISLGRQAAIPDKHLKKLCRRETLIKEETNAPVIV